MIPIGQINTTIRLNVGNANKALSQMAGNIDKIATAIGKAEKAASRITININNVDRRINNINKSVNTTNKTTVQTGTAVQRITSAIGQANGQVISAINNAARAKSTAQQTNTVVQQVAASTRTAAQNTRELAPGFNNAKSAADGLLRTVRSLAGGYLALQAVKTALATSDTITSAENKFINMDSVGAGQSQNTMDKIYNAAQDARTGYSDMLSNVGKAMTLSPDAFQGNVDNAIKFQEIMAKAYTVGGASAAEQSTSMYQMIQALGSGILQGDELRSVREGAPIAYKEIEKFAQGVFDTEDSLKDMASQGMITSDIVVAAVMGMGDSIDEKFDKTSMTFAQFWTSFKNDSVKAFEPFLQKLNDVLNNPAFQVFWESAQNVLTFVADGLMALLNVLNAVLTWAADNWSWLQYIVMAGLIAIGLLLGVLAAKAAIAGAIMIAKFVALNGTLVAIIAVIAAVIAAIVWAANAAASGIEFVVLALGILAAAIFLIGVITGNVVLIVIGAVVALAALFLNFADTIMAIAYSVGAGLWNLLLGVVRVFGGVIVALLKIVESFADFLGNVMNDPVASIIRLFEGLGETVLSILSTIAKAIDSIFGSNLASIVNGWKDNLNTKADILVDLYGNGSYVEGTSKADELQASLDAMVDDNRWAYTDAWSAGAEVGAGIQDWANDIGNTVKDKINGLTDFSEKSDEVAEAVAQPDFSLDGLQSPINDTASNTGRMADSMELTEEDLRYLREIAEMEWKQEFTTREVTVNMGGVNNTVNEKSDLQGIVTYLSDALREDLENSALGVHT